MKDFKLQVICVFIGFFLSSCANRDQNEQSVKKDAPVESLYEKSQSPKYNCDDLETNFSTYDEAKVAIENTKFRIEETIDTSESSWIRGASYYSCDGNTGFFVLITDSQDYLYMDMPINVWNGFKNAESFGSYYNQNIKNKYAFQLN